MGILAERHNETGSPDSKIGEKIYEIDFYMK